MMMMILISIKKKKKFDVATSYFNTLFQACNNYTSYLPVIENIPHCVSPYDNAPLLASFTKKEFRIALFNMNFDKSPSSDSLNPIFYKKIWHLCGSEVYHSGITWLETGSFPIEVNATTIVLIPKISNLTCIKDFRLMSQKSLRID